MSGFKLESRHRLLSQFVKIEDTTQGVIHVILWHCVFFCFKIEPWLGASKRTCKQSALDGVRSYLCRGVSIRPPVLLDSRMVLFASVTFSTSLNLAHLLSSVFSSLNAWNPVSKLMSFGVIARPSTSVRHIFRKVKNSHLAVNPWICRGVKNAPNLYYKRWT